MMKGISMKQPSSTFKTLIASLYPYENLSDYELNERAISIIQFFTTGAKEVYRFHNQKNSGSLKSSVQSQQINVL